MFSPFIAFINGIMVNIIWLFFDKNLQKNLFDLKVKKDFYNVMSTD